MPSSTYSALRLKLLLPAANNSFHTFNISREFENDYLMGFPCFKSLLYFGLRNVWLSQLVIKWGISLPSANSKSLVLSATSWTSSSIFNHVNCKQARFFAYVVFSGEPKPSLSKYVCYNGHSAASLLMMNFFTLYKITPVVSMHPLKPHPQSHV